MKVQQSKIGRISINFPNGAIPLRQRTKFAGYCCISAFHPKLPDFHIKVFLEALSDLADNTMLVKSNTDYGYSFMA